MRTRQAGMQDKRAKGSGMKRGAALMLLLGTFSVNCAVSANAHAMGEQTESACPAVWLDTVSAGYADQRDDLRAQALARRCSACAHDRFAASASRVNGVIVYLVSPRATDVADLSHSLALLDQNLFQVFERCYDIVIFHDGLSQAQMLRIRHSAPSCTNRVRIRLVDLMDVPARARAHAAEAAKHAHHQTGDTRGAVDDRGGAVSSASGMNLAKHAQRGSYAGLGGYRYMCRFMAGAVFAHESLASYDFYMRLDSDSYLVGKMTLDPFEEMARGDFSYAFLQDSFKEQEYVVSGLAEAMGAFLRHMACLASECARRASAFLTAVSACEEFQKRLAHEDALGRGGRRAGLNGEGGMGACTDVALRHFTRRAWKNTYFYNNFEVLRLADFRPGSPYSEWFDHVDGNGGIFRSRWGDAPIRTLGVLFLIPSSKLLDLRGRVDYMHPPFLTCASQPEFQPRSLPSRREGTGPGAFAFLFDRRRCCPQSRQETAAGHTRAAGGSATLSWQDCASWPRANMCQDCKSVPLGADGDECSLGGRRPQAWDATISCDDFSNSPTQTESFGSDGAHGGQRARPQKMRCRVPLEIEGVKDLTKEGSLGQDRLDSDSGNTSAWLNAWPLTCVVSSMSKVFG